MALTINNVGEKFPIVLPTTTGIPVGTICYLQSGVKGSPLGLLLSLTTTPSYTKVISVGSGFSQVS